MGVISTPSAVSSVCSKSGTASGCDRVGDAGSASEGGSGTSVASFVLPDALLSLGAVGDDGDCDLTGTAAVLSGCSTSSRDSCRPRSRSWSYDVRAESEGEVGKSCGEGSTTGRGAGAFVTDIVGRGCAVSPPEEMVFVTFESADVDAAGPESDTTGIGTSAPDDDPLPRSSTPSPTLAGS